jgi:hypothetical protein
MEIVRPSNKYIQKGSQGSNKWLHHHKNTLRVLVKDMPGQMHCLTRPPKEIRQSLEKMISSMLAGPVAFVIVTILISKSQAMS